MIPSMKVKVAMLELMIVADIWNDKDDDEVCKFFGRYRCCRMINRRRRRHEEGCCFFVH